ncbi:MAG: hypothetical protein ABI892_13035 [Flavobacterium sp.]
MSIEIKNITTRSATNNDLPKLTQFLEELVEAERPFDPTLVDGKIVYYDIQELILDKQHKFWWQNIIIKLLAVAMDKFDPVRFTKSMNFLAIWDLFL